MLWNLGAGTVGFGGGIKFAFAQPILLWSIEPIHVTPLKAQTSWKTLGLHAQRSRASRIIPVCWPMGKTGFILASFSCIVAGRLAVH